MNGKINPVFQRDCNHKDEGNVKVGTVVGNKPGGKLVF